VIADDSKAFHMAKLVSNWTNDLIIFTNGKEVLSLEEQELLKSKGIRINEKKIATFIGEAGMLEKIQFEDGTSILREGGFIATEWLPVDSFISSLGYTLNEQGGIVTDSMKRTQTEGVFVRRYANCRSLPINYRSGRRQYGCHICDCGTDRRKI
jgi:thioredoxin reductase